MSEVFTSIFISHASANAGTKVDIFMSSCQFPLQNPRCSAEQTGKH